jgi:signal recognition particle receptor subunit beta
MFVNWQLREVNLKIVYYGPALSGKTTNLEQIHDRIDPRKRSDLISLKTHEDRTLFFDFMELELVKISGLLPKIQLYTVPGQVYYEASRRIVLRGVDGIVFVADSNPDRLNDVLDSWKNMQKNLSELGLSLADMPLVVQLNKRDLPNAIHKSTLTNLLHVNGHPVYEAIAYQGKGVGDTLKAIISSVLNSVQRELV